MSAARTALRALHAAAGIDPHARWRIDEPALAGEMMRRKGWTLEKLREQGITRAQTGIDADVVIRTTPTPFALAALRIAADHPDFAELPEDEQVRVATQYLPDDEEDRPMTAPADLDAQVGAARDTLHALRRTMLDLQRAYADLDANALEVDELGDPTSAPEALESAVDALRSAQDTLGMADADLDVARRHTSRLRERE